MQNSGERTSVRQAAVVIGAAVALLVVTTVLLVPHEGMGMCMFSGSEPEGGFDLGWFVGFGVQLGDCSTAWTSLVGIPTGYVLWAGMQILVIAAAVLAQALLLGREPKPID